MLAFSREATAGMMSFVQVQLVAQLSPMLAHASTVARGGAPEASALADRETRTQCVYFCNVIEAQRVVELTQKAQGDRF